MTVIHIPSLWYDNKNMKKIEIKKIKRYLLKNKKTKCRIIMTIIKSTENQKMLLFGNWSESWKKGYIFEAKVKTIKHTPKKILKEYNELMNNNIILKEW